MSKVDASTTVESVWLPFQRKCFYAAGLFWVFYTDGTNIVYRTSSDGSSWSASTTLIADNDADCLSVWFDGTYVHYVYAINVANNPLTYRRGTPESNGTITWSADAQTVAAADANKVYQFPTVAVNSEGRPFVTYIEQSGATQWLAFVDKSTNTDGTWSGDPYHRWGITPGESGVNWKASVVPMRSGKMAILAAKAGAARPQGMGYPGSGDWLARINPGAATTVAYADSWSVCHGSGDVAWMGFMHNASGLWILPFKMYSPTSQGFGSGEMINQSSKEEVLISYDRSGTQLYCFWEDIDAGKIVYKVANSKAFDPVIPPTVLADESASGLTGYKHMQCFPETQGGYVGVVYPRFTVSPYDVAFGYLGSGVPAGEAGAPIRVYQPTFAFRAPPPFWV